MTSGPRHFFSVFQTVAVTSLLVLAAVATRGCDIACVLMFFPYFAWCRPALRRIMGAHMRIAVTEKNHECASHF